MGTKDLNGPSDLVRRYSYIGIRGRGSGPWCGAKREGRREGKLERAKIEVRTRYTIGGVEWKREEKVAGYIIGCPSVYVCR